MSPANKLMVSSLGRDRDFYPRFRAIAGLPDERLMRRTAAAEKLPQLEIVFEGLLDDGTGS